jgi:hypothetical protein
VPTLDDVVVQVSWLKSRSNYPEQHVSIGELLRYLCVCQPGVEIVDLPLSSKQAIAQV